jgi:hypothetical protein
MALRDSDRIVTPSIFSFSLFFSSNADVINLFSAIFLVSFFLLLDTRLPPIHLYNFSNNYYYQ